MKYVDLIRQLKDDDERVERNRRLQRCFQDIRDLYEQDQKRLAELEQRGKRLRWINNFVTRWPL